MFMIGEVKHWYGRLASQEILHRAEEEEWVWWVGVWAGGRLEWWSNMDRGGLCSEQHSSWESWAEVRRQTDHCQWCVRGLPPRHPGHQHSQQRWSAGGVAGAGEVRWLIIWHVILDLISWARPTQRSEFQARELTRKHCSSVDVGSSVYDIISERFSIWSPKHYNWFETILHY